MMLFELHRIEDESGVSGTGIVAQGVVFDDGRVSFRWLTPKRSTVFFDSVEEMEAIHGHNGKTRVRFLVPDNVLCFDAKEGRKCTRYSAGADGERRAIGDFLKHVPDRVADDWGMNAIDEIRKHVVCGNAAKGKAFWER